MKSWSHRGPATARPEGPPNVASGTFSGGVQDTAALATGTMTPRDRRICDRRALVHSTRGLSVVFITKPRHTLESTRPGGGDVDHGNTVVEERGDEQIVAAAVIDVH